MYAKMSVTSPGVAHLKYETDCALALLVTNLVPTAVFPRFKAGEEAEVEVGEGVGVGVGVGAEDGVGEGVGEGEAEPVA